MFASRSILTQLFLVVLLLSVAYSSADEKKYVVPVEGSPACGPPDAAITIIEFLDYQ